MKNLMHILPAATPSPGARPARLVPHLLHASRAPVTALGAAHGLLVAGTQAGGLAVTTFLWERPSVPAVGAQAAVHRTLQPPECVALSSALVCGEALAHADLCAALWRMSQAAAVAPPPYLASAPALAHSHRVTHALLLSPLLAVSASEDLSLKLWAVGRESGFGAHVRSWRAHSAPITGLCAIPEYVPEVAYPQLFDLDPSAANCAHVCDAPAASCASASADGTVRVWHTHKNAAVRVFSFRAAGPDGADASSDSPATPLSCLAVGPVSASLEPGLAPIYQPHHLCLRCAVGARPSSKLKPGPRCCKHMGAYSRWTRKALAYFAWWCSDPAPGADAAADAEERPSQSLRHVLHDDERTARDSWPAPARTGEAGGYERVAAGLVRTCLFAGTADGRVLLLDPSSGHAHALHVASAAAVARVVVSQRLYSVCVALTRAHAAVFDPRLLRTGGADGPNSQCVVIQGAAAPLDVSLLWDLNRELSYVPSSLLYSVLLFVSASHSLSRPQPPAPAPLRRRPPPVLPPRPSVPHLTLTLNHRYPTTPSLLSPTVSAPLRSAPVPHAASLAVHPTGLLAAVASRDGAVRTLALPALTVVGEAAHAAEGAAIAFHDCMGLVVAHRDGVSSLSV
jgi:hypothetical protein